MSINCYNSCNGCGNGGLGINESSVYMLAVLLIFGGGGFGPGSFWGGYNNIFSCSAFNNRRCNNFSNNTISSGNYSNSNISSNNLSNSATSNDELAGLLAGLSGGLFAGLSSSLTNGISDDSSLNVGNITDSSI